MLARRVDRWLVLAAASVLAAVSIVGWLTPRGPADRGTCGMDASFYLAGMAGAYLGARLLGWVINELVVATIRGLFGDGKPARPPDPEFPDLRK